MLDNFDERMKAVDWSQYETAYGSAERNSVATKLSRLASHDHEDAMTAAHELWCGLCHQYAYISSAALPALPFILEVLDYANDELTLEILDILRGFAVCSVYPIPVPKDFENLSNDSDCRKKLRNYFSSFERLLQASAQEIGEVPGVSEERALSIYECLHPKEPDTWVHTLRKALQKELPRFISLSSHADESISYFASEIVSQLTTEPEVPDVEIEIYVKYLGNEAEHYKAEECVRDTLAKLDCIYDGYQTWSSLSPGQFTKFSITAPKSLAQQVIESLTGAGLTAGSYVKRYDDTDVPL